MVILFVCNDDVLAVARYSVYRRVLHQSSCFLQAMLCNVTPAWAPIMTTATGKAPNLVPATLTPVLWWWAMTVSPSVTV